MTLERLPNETDLQYHKRLIYGKLIDKTLSDMDYSELAPFVYGKTYAPDVARRMMYGSCRTLQMLDSQIEDNLPSDISAELDEKLYEIRKETQKLRDQRREYNKLVIAESRAEHLEDRLVEAANNLDTSVGRLNYGDIPCSFTEDEAVLVLNDWHYGMETNNVWNSYNVDTCIERVQHVISAAADRIRLHGCERLHIVILGDMFHGGCHVSARVASEELVCDQLMNVAEVIAQSIEYISQSVKRTLVYTTYGNHARTIQSKEDSIHRDNMERIIPWWLAQRLKGHDDIEIVSEFDNELMFFDVCGYNICATHGDLDRVKSSPRLLSTLAQKRFGRGVDYVLLGDKHHSESFEELGVRAMICGALCGTDDYANDKRLYSSPEQVLLIFSPECGLDAEYHIQCERRV